MKRIVIVILAGIMQITLVNAMSIENPSKPQNKLSQEGIRHKVASLGQTMSTLQQKGKDLRGQAEQKMLAKMKRDLGIVSRNIDSTRKEILMAIAKKPVGGFNAAQRLSDIQDSINQTYGQLQSMAQQQRAQALAKIATDMESFQNTVKASLPSDLLKDLANLQGKIYILAEKAKKLPANEQAAIKQTVQRMYKDAENLVNAGLSQEAQNIKEKIEEFNKAQGTSVAEMREAAAKIVGEAREAYNKALAQ
jgi:hypothetical protein